jgi:hypothetical protein
MRRRRITVAWEEVESPQARTFRHAWARLTVEQILAEPRRVPLGRFWCGADRPHESVPVRRVYDGTRVPEDAECEECGIRIGDLAGLVRGG